MDRGFKYQLCHELNDPRKQLWASISSSMKWNDIIYLNIAHGRRPVQRRRSINNNYYDCVEESLAYELHIRQKRMVRNGRLFSYKNAPKGSILPWAVIYNFFFIIRMKSVLCRMFYLQLWFIVCMEKNRWHVEKIFSRKRFKSLSSKKRQRPSSLNPIDFWWRFKRLFTYFPSFLSEL